MDKQQITRIYKKSLRPGYGPIIQSEAMFIQDLIIEHRPKRFLEVGTGSGISGGLIANFLDENGGAELVTIDLQEMFFGDQSKVTGYLIDEIYSKGRIQIERHRGTTCVDYSSLVKEQFDMVFIDANHQHPWPVLDTLFVLPFISETGVLIHHDLNLFKVKNFRHGIGPRHLADAVSCQMSTCQDGRENIFALQLQGWSRETALKELLHALELPWTLIQPINPEQAGKIGRGLERLWGTEVKKRFSDIYDLECEFRKARARP